MRRWCALLDFLNFLMDFLIGDLTGGASLSVG